MLLSVAFARSDSFFGLHIQFGGGSGGGLEGGHSRRYEADEEVSREETGTAGARVEREPLHNVPLGLNAVHQIPVGLRITRGLPNRLDGVEEVR